MNNTWIWPVAVAAVILWLVFVWKEWSQSGSQRFFPKSVVAFCAVASLALIALKPAVTGTPEEKKAVILTEAYDSDQLDSLQDSHRNLNVLEYDPGEPLLPQLNSMSQVFILGQGIKPFDLWQLDQVPTTYMGGKPTTGVVRLQYDQEKSIGDRLVIEGLYNAPQEGNRLVLQEPGGTGVDSVSLGSGETQEFRLTANLRVEGKFLYSLLEKDSLGEQLSMNPLPVKVRAKKPLSILMINSYPTFETRHLKNFLAEAGHEVLVRSRLTRGKFRYEYLNMERISLGTLSEANLEHFDLLLIDAGSLRTLAAGERNAVEASVAEKGLGVFIQPDDTFFNAPGNLADFSYIRVNTTEASPIEESNITLPKQPFLFQDQFGLQAIHSSGDAILSAYRRKGRGRIGSTVLANTYELVLGGETTAYQQVWSQIIEKVSKKQNMAAWESNTFVAYKDEPFHFTLRTSTADPVIENQTGHTIPLMGDIDIPGLWKGTTYPRETGWNRLMLQQDSSAVFEYYVSDRSHCKSLSAYNTIAENSRYFDGAAKIEGEKQRPLDPIDPLWFFLTFLVSAGYLWLDPKLFS